jgi:membrane protein DedA with SNARE-associated domain/rhodanese-related sulfurtransferase
LLSQWGLPLIFGAVVLEQGGLPLPAAPLLVAAGALAVPGAMQPEQVLAVAFVACLLADHAWFFSGRRFGRRLLAGVCRLSLSPDTCVQRTDVLTGRHGAAVLMVAKFIPGVSAVAIPTAAAAGLSYRRFLTFDALGGLLWSGSYLGAGMIFSREVTGLLRAMDWVAGGALAVVGAALVAYLAWKLLHRWRLRRLYRAVRISPDEIPPLLEQEPELVILDARSPLAHAEDPRTLPRSIVLAGRAVFDVLPAAPRDRLIVTFCTCPNEASAALLAKQLLDAGYRRVRVLTGGSATIALLGRASSP